MPVSIIIANRTKLTNALSSSAANDPIVRRVTGRAMLGVKTRSAGGGMVASRPMLQTGCAHSGAGRVMARGAPAALREPFRAARQREEAAADAVGPPRHRAQERREALRVFVERP